MSKSNWLKDEDQKGNFSNDKQDTFDPKKGYIGIRLQQGVPLLDRDWNELEDIRRYAEVMLRRHYIGSGTPDENSFKISPTNPPTNDFKIAAGCCLVDGFEAVSENVLNYSQQDGAGALNVPTLNRSDTVYLDVWIEEVTSAEEESLKNSQDVNIETCIRHKVKWRVFVIQGGDFFPEIPYGHYYYKLALINRKKDKSQIENHDIEDLRRTNLSVYHLIDAIKDITTGAGTHKHSKLTAPDGAPDPSLMVTNKGYVGIGTVDPKEKLHINGSVRGDQEGGMLRINTEHGYIDMGPRNPGWGHIQTDRPKFYFNKEIRVATGLIGSYTEDLQLRTEETTRMTILKSNGNVGIGTTNPQQLLHVKGTLLMKKWETEGSDYAEYFESKSDKAIPVGTAVVLENGKVRQTKKNETPLGIISANPGGVSGVHVEWPKKYLRDEFGNDVVEEYKDEIMVPKKEKVKKDRQKTKKKTIKEKVRRTDIVLKNDKYCQVEIEETIEKEIEEPVFKEVDLYDAEGKNAIGKHQVPVMETYEEEIDILDENGQPVMVGIGEFETKTRPKINPEYDETKEYISRNKRPEWNCVGLLGQIPLRKDQPTAPSWVKIKDISKDVELWLVK